MYRFFYSSGPKAYQQEAGVFDDIEDVEAYIRWVTPDIAALFPREDGSLYILFRQGDGITIY